VVRGRIGALRRLSVVHVHDDAGHCGADFRARGVLGGERAEKVAAAVVEYVYWEGGGMVGLGGTGPVDAQGDGGAVAGGDGVVLPGYFGVEAYRGMRLVLKFSIEVIEADLATSPPELIQSHGWSS
jgi:hypothetical protein